MEKNSSKNSIKLTHTLSELEAALHAWDNPEVEIAAAPAPVEQNRINKDNVARKRAQDLLKQLREQIEQLSED